MPRIYWRRGEISCLWLKASSFLSSPSFTLLSFALLCFAFLSFSFLLSCFFFSKRLKLKFCSSSKSDNTVKIWEVSKGSSAHELKGHTSRIWDLSSSLNGELLCSASGDGTVKVCARAEERGKGDRGKGERGKRNREKREKEKKRNGEKEKKRERTHFSLLLSFRCGISSR